MAVATSSISDTMQRRGRILANYNTTSLHDSAFVEVCDKILPSDWPQTVTQYDKGDNTMQRFQEHLHQIAINNTTMSAEQM